MVGAQGLHQSGLRDRRPRRRRAAHSYARSERRDLSDAGRHPRAGGTGATGLHQYRGGCRRPAFARRPYHRDLRRRAGQDQADHAHPRRRRGRAGNRLSARYGDGLGRKHRQARSLRRAGGLAPPQSATAIVGLALSCAPVRQAHHIDTVTPAAMECAMTGALPGFPTFQAPFAPADDDMAAGLLAAVIRDAAAESRIDARAQRLVEAIRAKAGGLGGVEEFLHAYSLSTKEGLALMVLAEALLRVPDAATADRLIEDKLAAGRWRDGDVKSAALLVSASAWTLGIAARVIHPGETPETILDSIVRRLGLPTVRAATRQAMRLLGSHFVLGQTIEEALHRTRGHAEFRYSFDMLGEGARTAADADKYFDAYATAIAAIGAQAGNAELPQRPGISVKLSALHPRYEAMSRERVLKELVPRLIELAHLARDGDLQFTVDAEEADRLELSFEIIAAVLGDASLAGWNGFGLAVQAYQKRALEVINWVEEVAAASRHRLTVRLVKGAYWDTEIKRAQERGLADYPVFTRKAMTDLCYMACVKRLLAARDRLFPQFATHNALTVASVIEDAGGF